MICKLNNSFSQSKSSTCGVFKENTDFLNDQEPSIKKLKKLMGKASEDIVLDYAIYLHDELKPKNIKYYNDFERAVSGESYPNQKLIEQKQLLVTKDYILPLANQGNLKAIGFLSREGYWKYSTAVNVISKFTIKNTAEKFAKHQLQFKSIEGVEWKNKYVLAQDSSLLSYFLDFKESDLLRLRNIIENKILEIKEIKKDFHFLLDDYDNSKVTRDSVLNKIPSAINDSTFCLSFGVASIYGRGNLKIVPKCFDGSSIFYDAVDYLEILRGSLDLILADVNPISLAQLLFDYKREKMINKWDFNYLNPENQYFATDTIWGRIIFKQLGGIISCDTSANNVNQKSYYLNRAAELGALDSYLNLACLYQTFYYNTKLNKYNDSCIYYLEKAISSHNISALTLKGIKLFNGEGYTKNKDEGLKLIIKAKNLGDSSAIKLLETLPQKIFEGGVLDGYYYNQSVKLNYPWDFKVLCSNGCGKYIYPEQIIFGRVYNNDINFPQIKGAQFWIDNSGNPIIYISENDFKRTFTITHLGFKDWKHVMCSATCQLAHENRNNKNWDALKNRRDQIDNEEIKCVACSNVLKRKDMISITDCPCYTETGSALNLSYIQSNDLHGDNEPKACSSECQVNFCKTRCASKGYTIKY